MIERQREGELYDKFSLAEPTNDSGVGNKKDGRLSVTVCMYGGRHVLPSSGLWGTKGSVIIIMHAEKEKKKKKPGFPRQFERPSRTTKISMKL